MDSTSLVTLTSASTAFLGGTAFRLFLTFAMDRYQASQEHRFELDRMKAQDLVDQKIHDRNLQAIRVQKELGVVEVPVQRVHEFELINHEDFRAAHKETREPSGFKFVDIANQAIRPALAILCMGIWLAKVASGNWHLSPWDLELIAATLGVFVGSRIHHKGA